MLKMAGIKLDLISDIDMYQLIQKGMRGEVNQKDINQKDIVNLMINIWSLMRKINHLNMSHGDANNLYVWALYHYLPVGGFKWLTQNEIGGLNVNTIWKDNPKDYILEVNLG